MELQDDALVKALKALADPTRFRMVQEIAFSGRELCCGEIAERFPLSQPTISHHLKILVEAGFLRMRPEAKHHFVSANRPFLDAVLRALRETWRAPKKR